LSRIWAKAPPLTSALFLRFLPHTRTDTQTEPEAHTEGHKRERERERETNTHQPVSVLSRPQGLGFTVYGLRFRVSGLGLGVFRRGDSQCPLKTVPFKAHVSNTLKTVSFKAHVSNTLKTLPFKIRSLLSAGTRCSNCARAAGGITHTHTHKHTHT